jgi:hypothetical protein
MDNAGDRKSIRRKEKESRLADRLRRDVVTSIMSTAPGRAWLWDMLSRCHIFHTTFNGDPLGTAFAEGQRSVGLALLSDIMAHCPDYYIQAMRESNERNILESTRSANAAASSDPGPSDSAEGPTGEPAGAGADSEADSDPRTEDARPIDFAADIYAEGPKG